MLQSLLILLMYFNQQLKEVSKYSNKSEDNNCFYDETYDNRLIYNTYLCFYRCTFQHIHSTSNKGGCIYLVLNGVITQNNYFEKCLFIDCSSTEGGAIYISTTEISNTEINNCTFERNTAKTRGGSISLFYSNFSIKMCNFLNNNVRAQSEDAYGGSFFISNSTGTIEMSNFFTKFSKFL